jgi:hypothetical protein
MLEGGGKVACSPFSTTKVVSSGERDRERGGVEGGRPSRVPPSLPSSSSSWPSSSSSRESDGATGTTRPVVREGGREGRK